MLRILFLHCFVSILVCAFPQAILTSMFKKVTLGGYTVAYNMSNQSVWCINQINSLSYLILSSNPYIINLWYYIIFEASMLFGKNLFFSFIFVCIIVLVKIRRQVVAFLSNRGVSYHIGTFSAFLLVS